MARLFDDAQNEYLSRTVAVVLSRPLTLACWANVANDAITGSGISIGNSGSIDPYFHLQFRGSVPGNKIGAEERLNGVQGAGLAVTDTGFTAGLWHHAAAVFVNDSSRFAYIDGVAGSENSDLVGAQSGLNRTSVGALVRNAVSQEFDGLIAWPAVWNVALTDEEVAALAAGAHPTTIRPANLVSFWPLGGFDTEETDGGIARDIWGGFDLTAFSDTTGPGIADHPGGLIYPSSPTTIISVGDVAPPTGFIPYPHVPGMTGGIAT